MTEREIAEKMIADAEQMAKEGKARLAELAELDKRPIRHGEKIIFKNTGQQRIALYDKHGILHAYNKHGDAQYTSLDEYQGSDETIFDDLKDKP